MPSLLSSKKKTSVMMYIFVYYLIIGSDCVLFCYNRNEALPRYSQYFIVFLALVFWVKAMVKKHFSLQNKDIMLLITVACILFTAAIHLEFSGGYISIIALFVLGNSFFDIVNTKEFVKTFLNIMTVICVVSLVTFFFASFACRIPFFPSIYNSLDREYRFFFFSNVAMIDPTRNYGLFTEPSRFQAYLNLSLMFILFSKDKRVDIKLMTLYIITLLTTFSTTGYIAFALIFIAFISSGKVKMKGTYKAAIVFAMIAVIVYLFTQNAEFFHSIDKITMGENSHSASTRFNSFFAMLRVIFENPVFGTGIGYADAAFAKALNDLGGVFASTNTITILIIYSKFGLVPGLFYSLNVFRAVKNISNNRNTLILVLAFIAMTCGITFVESIIFNIILFYRNRDSKVVIGEIRIR